MIAEVVAFCQRIVGGHARRGSQGEQIVESLIDEKRIVTRVLDFRLCNMDLVNGAVIVTCRSCCMTVVHLISGWCNLG